MLCEGRETTEAPKAGHVRLAIKGGDRGEAARGEVMILSGRDLRWYLDTGKLVITPVSEQTFQQNGADLVLHDINIEWSGSNVSDRHKEYTPHRKMCDIATPYLGGTREWLEVPDDLMGFVNIRSSFARAGFIIPPTIIDAGFKGNITIEIVSFRHQPAPLGERFIHVVFAKLTSPSIPYAGKYQGQIGITPHIPD